MRKSLSLTGILLITILVLSACGPAGPPKAGKAKADNMLALLPVDCQGAFFMDVKRAMATDLMKSTIKQDEGGKDLQEFIEGTGINPEEDIYFMALGVAAKDAEGKSGGAAVLNLLFEKDKVLAFMQKKAEEMEKAIEEIEYEGDILYGLEEDDEKMFLVFLDEANIVAGNEGAVKGVLDVVKKKKDSILKNDDLQALLKASNKNAIFWGGMMIPRESMEKATSSNPMLSSLNAVKSISLYFDHANENLEIEILAMSDNSEQNTQVADFLTGIKGLGGMMAAEKPEVGQILNSITISSAEDHVKISAVIPEHLLKSVMEKELASKGEEEIQQ
jgi:hypothetical protein